MLRLADITVTPPGVPGVTLFHIDELVIRPGDRVALLGPNGCGKTSLISLIVNRYRSDAADADPSVRFSPQAEIGYYDQELQEVMRGSPGQSMTDFLRRSTRAEEVTIRNGLITSGFPYLEHNRRIDVLSGGERARLMFLQLRLNRPNVLVMDEPTNHIDIDGKEELEEQLSNSDATLLMTSHDRRFIDNVATRFLLVADGGINEIHDPDRFYSSAIVATSHAGFPARLAPTHSVAAARTDAPGERFSSDEQLLERIVELERLIAEEADRKPKFQKPKRQRAWQAELDTLMAELEQRK